MTNACTKTRMGWARSFLSAVLITVFVPACYKTTNVALFQPLDTPYPVSASAQYLDASGQIVDERSYRVVKAFSFNQTAKGARHEETHSSLNLAPRLDPLVRGAQGDAVTNLKIEAVDYDSSSHDYAALLKSTGWILGLIGAAVFVGGVATKGNDRTGVMIGGGVTAGVGVLGYVGGILTDSPTAWHFDVSGQVVKRSLPPPPLAVPAAPVDAEPAPVHAAPPPASPSPTPTESIPAPSSTGAFPSGAQAPSR
jgi:hypothetical protein